MNRTIFCLYGGRPLNRTPYNKDTSIDIYKMFVLHIQSLKSDTLFIGTLSSLLWVSGVERFQLLTSLSSSVGLVSDTPSLVGMGKPFWVYSVYGNGRMKPSEHTVTSPVGLTLPLMVLHIKNWHSLLVNVNQVMTRYVVIQ